MLKAVMSNNISEGEIMKWLTNCGYRCRISQYVTATDNINDNMVNESSDEKSGKQCEQNYITGISKRTRKLLEVHGFHVG